MAERHLANTMFEMYAYGTKPGSILSSTRGSACLCRTITLTAKTANLKVKKTWLSQLLGSLLLAYTLHNTIKRTLKLSRLNKVKLG